ncbi:MAG: SpoIIE family protein phosphatase [Planctomycetaceae bacterium]|nr:SpoIIE family protein phosphatase [Planctomycetaceae bacterium]
MMKPHSLPRSVVSMVMIVTAIILMMSMLGWGVDYSEGWLSEETIQIEQIGPELLQYYAKSGPFLHTIFEWTSVCLAIFTGILSVVHFRLKYDVTTPIIGTALFFSGMLDAFHILAADELLFHVKDLGNFIPFTWALSRTFNVAILTAGTLPFLVRTTIPQRDETVRNTRYLVLVGVLFGLMAYAIIQICSVVPSLPESFYPELMLSRPWEAIPFLFWVFLGAYVLPRFWKKNPSLFSHSLILTAVPAAALHLVAGFGSHALFDANFFNAYLLKIVAYGTPLIGLLLDYKNAYRAELKLEKTASNLEAARQIQQSLLPRNHLEMEGLDAAGFSYASEAVGGDYYDYVKMSDGRFAFCVGDVSGHDLAASLLASQSRAYFRAYANSLTDFQEIMNRLNCSLAHDTQHRRFVTMFMVAMAPNRKSFEYAAAGHQAFLIRADGQVETLESQGVPLGMSSEMPVQIAVKDRIHLGDTILIVTDGITEALSPAGEQYGLERLLDFISVEHEKSVHEISKRLHEDVMRFCEGHRPTDDVTVLLVRCTDESLP